MELLDKTFGDGRRDVVFVEEEPYHFRRVRMSQRISDEEYNWYALIFKRLIFVIFAAFSYIYYNCCFFYVTHFVIAGSSKRRSRSA